MLGSMEDSETGLVLGEALTTLLAHALEPLLVACPNGQLVAANEPACTLFGYSHAELVRLRREHLFELEDPRVAALVAERQATGRTRGALRARRRDGSLVEVELTSTEIEIGGTPMLWLSLLDLTERRRAEAAEERFRALSEASQEAVFFHRNGRIVVANDAACAQYRIERDAFVGRPLDDFVAPSSRAFIARMSREQHPGPYEAEGLRADGTLFPGEIVARTTVFRGKPVRVVCVRDLTARKQMEADLAMADRLAAIGSLAAGVAHEVNNPLTYVLINLAMVIEQLEHASPRRPFDERKGLEALLDARAGAERVRDIVRGLLAFSRTDEGKPGPVDLARVIERTTKLVASDLRHRARLHVEVGLVPRVRGSETKLGQVLLNLLVNAAQAIPEGAIDRHRVDVRVHPAEGGMVALEVHDTGSGIPAELRARIFEPFVTTKAPGAGTGLGLSICHGIVTQLGGRIEVESEPGHGTTFRVLLPAAAGATSRPPAAPRAAARQARHARVLLVDDEERLRERLTSLLADDYDVVSAASGHEALAVVERDPAFDVVVCDLLMAEFTGMDVHQALWERSPALAHRMLFTTGGYASAHAEAFVAAHAARVVAKPFEMPQLRAAIERVIAESID
jgi:PAS domain S-box-containing protein